MTNIPSLRKLDENSTKRFWYPFTQMKEWMGRDLNNYRGRGSFLKDITGK
jgi:hypothetical protein